MSMVKVTVGGDIAIDNSPSSFVHMYKICTSTIILEYRHAL